MIELEFETAIFLYLLISIFGLLFIWLLFSRIKIPANDQTQLESIWQCSICTYIYVDSKNKKFSACPRCKSFNERLNGLKGGGH
jgi:hypothetical protein